MEVYRREGPKQSGGNAGSLVFGLDVGTTKICALVGEKKEGRRLEMIGVGSSPSFGLRKGVVVDIQKTVNSIKHAVEEAEKASGVRSQAVYVGIAGDHVYSTNSSASIKLKSRDKEIKNTHKDRVIRRSLRFKVPKDNRIIHTIPREFILDGVDGVSEPVGMSANNLEVKTHIVMGAVPSIQNLIKSVEMAGVTVSDIVLEPIASAEAVLTSDERDLGTALIDIGGGTTDLAIFIESGICHSRVFPFGGNHVTRDIAVGLRVTPKEAETIKIRHGQAQRKTTDPLALIRVRDMHDKKERGVLKVNLSGIIEARMSEILHMVRKEIEKSGMHKLLAGGVVLTGGASQLDGIDELASEILEVPVRVGTPRNIKGPAAIVRNSMYATGAGLLIYGYKHKNQKRPKKPRINASELTQKILDWFTDKLPEKIA